MLTNKDDSPTKLLARCYSFILTWDPPEKEKIAGREKVDAQTQPAEKVTEPRGSARANSTIEGGNDAPVR